MGDIEAILSFNPVKMVRRYKNKLVGRFINKLQIWK